MIGGPCGRQNRWRQTESQTIPRRSVTTGPPTVDDGSTLWHAVRIVVVFLYGKLLRRCPSRSFSIFFASDQELVAFMIFGSSSKYGRNDGNISMGLWDDSACNSGVGLCSMNSKMAWPASRSAACKGSTSRSLACVIEPAIAFTSVAASL
jgi:hypothetical protein